MQSHFSSIGPVTFLGSCTTVATTNALYELIWSGTVYFTVKLSVIHLWVPSHKKCLLTFCSHNVLLWESADLRWVWRRIDEPNIHHQWIRCWPSMASVQNHCFQSQLSHQWWTGGFQEACYSRNPFFLKTKPKLLFVFWKLRIWGKD